MSKLAMGMAVAALLCAPLGCNKNSDQPRSPSTTTPTTTTTPSTTTTEPSMTPAAGQSDFGSGTSTETDIGGEIDTSGSGTWGSDTSEPSVDPGATPELRGGDAGVQDDDMQSPDEGAGSGDTGGGTGTTP